MTKKEMPHRNFVFVSNMNGAPWGGSEELWAGAALRLAKEGTSVAASICSWSPLHAKVTELAHAGVAIQVRRPRHSIFRRAWQKVTKPTQALEDLEIAKLISAASPALVVMSCTPFWLSLIEECARKEVPFVTVSQANTESLWPNDLIADRFRRLLPAARRCYFVSNANRRLTEYQIGCELPNAEIVWNPFNVRRDVSLGWPELSADGELRLASVARLHPASKGHDILFEALACPRWRSRRWHLRLYGDGPMRDTIVRMISRLGLTDRVSLAGFVDSIENVWAENHALVMPSRYEGMPLAMVEAMLCARPVLATDVADHAEIVIDGITGFLADATTARSVDNALERLWTNRMNLRSIGETAAARIRAKLPLDPVRDFVEKLKREANT